MTKRPTQPAPDRSPRTLALDDLRQANGGWITSQIMAAVHEMKKEIIANYPR